MTKTEKKKLDKIAKQFYPVPGPFDNIGGNAIYVKRQERKAFKKGFKLYYETLRKLYNDKN